MSTNDTPLVALHDAARHQGTPQREEAVRTTETVGDPDAHEPAAAAEGGAATGALIGAVVGGPLGMAAGAGIGGAVAAAGEAVDGDKPYDGDQRHKEDQLHRKEARR